MESKFVKAIAKIDKQHITGATLCKIIYDIYNDEELLKLYDLVIEPEIMECILHYKSNGLLAKKKSFYNNTIKVDNLKSFYNLFIMFDKTFTFSLEDVKKIKYPLNGACFSLYENNISDIDIVTLLKININDVYLLINESFNNKKDIEVCFLTLTIYEKLKLINHNTIAYDMYKTNLVDIIKKCDVYEILSYDNIPLMCYYNNNITVEDILINIPSTKVVFEQPIIKDEINFKILTKKIVNYELNDYTVIKIINNVYSIDNLVASSKDIIQLLKTNTMLNKLSISLRIELFGAVDVLRNDNYTKSELKELVNINTIKYVNTEGRRYYFKNVVLTMNIINELAKYDTEMIMLSNNTMTKDLLLSYINQVEGDVNLKTIKLTFNASDIENKSDKVIKHIVNQKFSVKQIESLREDFNYTLVNKDIILQSRKLMNKFVKQAPTKDIAIIDRNILLSLPNFSYTIAEQLLNYDKTYLHTLLFGNYKKIEVYNKYLDMLSIEELAQYHTLFPNIISEKYIDTILKKYEQNSTEAQDILREFLVKEYAYAHIYFNYDNANILLDKIELNTGVGNDVYEILHKIIKKIKVPEQNKSIATVLNTHVEEQYLNSYIKQLKEQGMLFDSKCDEVEASNYIDYNTSWSMLKRSTKQFSKYINGNHKEKPYSGITFYEVMQAGLLDYHYNDFLAIILKEFEQSLKVLMSRIYTNLENEDVKVIDEYINKYDFHVRRNLYIKKELYETIDDIFNYTSLYELIDIFNSCFFDKQDVIKIGFSSAIAIFLRNNVSHYNVALYGEQYEAYYEYKDVLEEMKQIPFKLTSKEENYLMKNKQNNNCYLALKLLIITAQMLHVHSKLDLRRANYFTKLEEEFTNCKNILTNTNKYDDWVYIHFGILNIALENTRNIYK